MNLSGDALNRGQIYARLNNAKFTYVSLMDVASFLNKLLTNDAINEQLVNNLNSVEIIPSHPKCLTAFVLPSPLKPSYPMQSGTVRLESCHQELTFHTIVPHHLNLPSFAKALTRREHQFPQQIRSMFAGTIKHRKKNEKARCSSPP